MEDAKFGQKPRQAKLATVVQKTKYDVSFSGKATTHQYALQATYVLNAW